MKIKIFNYDHLKEKDINSYVIRVKAILINQNKEVLIGEAYRTPQFIGGHKKPHESLMRALKREILEETGITINQNYEPFLCLKHYLKDYPHQSTSTALEIYYYYIPCDTKYNLRKQKLDAREKKGNFHLNYIPLKDLKVYLKNHEPLNPINKIINKEMNIALKTLEKEVEL